MRKLMMAVGVKKIKKRKLDVLDEVSEQMQ